MKKDYIPVEESQTHLDEAAFVEAYWTRMWDGQTFPSAAQQDIERRDEFRVMDPYLSTLAPKSRLLDGGCGLGEWSLYYASRGYEVVGLDISRATIERLASRFPQHTFITGDLRKTTFADASFHAYYSWGTFEHFEEGLGPCLREAARILKPHGYLFISIPFQNGRHTRRDAKPLRHWDEHFDPQLGYRMPMRFYQWRLTESELQRELEIHGFKTLKMVPIHKWDGLHRFTRHNLGLNPRSRGARLLQRLLYPVIPRQYVAHMLMAVAQRRATAGDR